MKLTNQTVVAEEAEQEYEYCTCDFCLGAGPAWGPQYCKYGADDEGRLRDPLFDDQGAMIGYMVITSEPQEDLSFPYVRQMIKMLEAGPVTTIKLATGKDVQFFGLQGADADFFYSFARRPEMSENTQSLLDNTELLGDALAIAGLTFGDVAEIMDEIMDEEVDFVIGLKTES